MTFFYKKATAYNKRIYKKQKLLYTPILISSLSSHAKKLEAIKVAQAHKEVCKDCRHDNSRHILFFPFDLFVIANHVHYTLTGRACQ